MRYKIKSLLESSQEFIDKNVKVSGWVKTVRGQKAWAFLELNDGSTIDNLQIVASNDLVADATTGSSITAEGKIVKSPGKGQNVEMQASKISLLGKCDATTYPLQKKQHSAEFLRSIAHLRPRASLQGAVARVKNELSFATHDFFHKRGFLYIHTPIITSSDCEGGGELFRVTTLPTGENDLSKDFFGHPTFLTVSGQLNVECFACALGDVYTFGPTFRAENSNTARHLAEFWMIEPEMAFADINDDMECAESYVRHLVSAVLKNCRKDLEYFDETVKKGLVERLEKITKTPFSRVTYTEAIEILQKSNVKFDFPVSWGMDLQTEHERYLSEKHFQNITIVINYPRKIKAFYMRDNEDGKTVAAMDILAPEIGEIVGGSQREERLDFLENKIAEFKLKKEDYSWYLDLRRFGSIPHAGFGLGFERMVQFVTGMDNIRDVIPFPRFPGHAEF